MVSEDLSWSEVQGSKRNQKPHAAQLAKEQTRGVPMRDQDKATQSQKGITSTKTFSTLKSRPTLISKPPKSDEQINEEVLAIQGGQLSLEVVEARIEKDAGLWGTFHSFVVIEYFNIKYKTSTA